MTSKQGTTSHYAKKPLTTEQLTKKSRFPNETTFKNYRKDPDLRPEHAKRVRK